MRGDLPSRPSSGSVTDDIWELLINCWASDPKGRPTVESITDTLWRLYTAKAATDFDWYGELDEEVFEEDEEDDFESRF